MYSELFAGISMFLAGFQPSDKSVSPIYELFVGDYFDAKFSLPTGLFTEQPGVFVYNLEST